MGGDRGGERLGGHAGSVVAPGIGVQLGGEAVARVLEVQVGGAHRRQALVPGRIDPQHPAADRPAQPLLARARIEGAAQRADVEADRSRRPARRRAGPARRARASASGRSAPVIQLTCEQATSLVRGPTASARSANGTARTSTPRRARSVVRGPSRPGCSSGAVTTSSPGPSSRPARTRTTPSLVHVVSATSAVSAPASPRRRRAGGRAARSASRRTPSRAPRRGPVEHLQARPHGGVGQRPTRAGVQVGTVGEDRELGAQRGGVHRAEATRPSSTPEDTCARRWRRCSRSIGSDEGHASRRHAARAPRRRQRRRRRRGDRAGARARRAGRQAERAAARPRAPLEADEPLEIITDRSGQDALDLIRHDAAHVLAAAVMELYPGREDLDRAADRERLLLRLRVPRRRHGLRRGLRGDRGEDARAHRRRRAVHARGRAGRRRRSSASAPRARTTRSSSSRTSSRDQRPVDTVSLYTNGPFTDLCRGPHAPSTKRIGAVKLQSVAGAYWRGDADRQMLTRIYGTAFFKQARARRVPRAARAGARPRPPQARARARAVHLLAAVTGLGVLAAAAAPRCSTRSSRSTAAMQAAARLRRGQDAAALRVPAVGDLRALGQVQGEHLRRRVRGSRVRPQADELPRPLRTCSACSTGPIATCRSATPSPGCCTAASRAARCTACCACATSSRTTPTSSAPRTRSRTRSRGCLDFAYDIYGMFDFPVHVELSTRPGRTGSATTRSGTTPRARSPRRSSSNGIDYTDRRGRGRRSTARRSTCT